MAITVTVNAATGSDIRLANFLHDGTKDNGSEQAGSYAVDDAGDPATPSRVLLKSSANDLVYVANIPVGNLDGVEVRTIGDNVLRATFTYSTAFSALALHTEMVGGSEDTISAIVFADDVIYTGNTGDDEFTSGAGDDTINGGDGDDTLRGGDGVDIINGENGDDLLVGNAGNDTINGGAGSDTINFSTNSSALTINLATQTATSVNSGTDALSSIENARGGTQADTITGSDGDNILRGGGGNDIMDGGADFDEVDYADKTVGQIVTVNLNGSTASIVQVNGVNEDTIVNFEGVRGGQAGDVLNGDAGDNSFRGNGGIDVIDGNGGNDFADFFDKAAQVVVTLAAGGAQVQAIVGGMNEDFLTEIENLRGGSVADTFTGNELDNVFRGRGGIDVLNGAAGNDTADFRDKSQAVVVTLNGDLQVQAIVGGMNEDFLTDFENLAGGTGHDILTGDAAVNELFGNDGLDQLNGLGGIDSLFGSFGNDTLNGGDNNDTLSGGADNDTLNGGAGNDDLTGDSGVDTLNGGAGNDTYRLGSSTNDTVAEIAGEGTADLINSTITRSLADYANVENSGPVRDRPKRQPGWSRQRLRQCTP